MDGLTGLIGKIRSTWAKATCRCEVDKLRFVRKIHGGEINIVYGNRYEYQCAVCGKTVYKERPITCEGCRYIASDKFGSILCCREYEDFCLLANREYRTEREAKQNA